MGKSSLRKSGLPCNAIVLDILLDKKIDMIEMQNLAKYRRYLLKETNLLVVRGGIAPVIAGMDIYNLRYGIAPPQKDLRSSVQELLASAALAAVSLADRESWGWSLSFNGMKVGFFVGVEPEGMICLRILGTEDKPASGLIQRQKSGLPMTQSHIEPRTTSPRDTVEQYFSEVDQTKTRLVIGENGEGVLVHSLPDGNFDTVKDLGTNELFAFIDNAIDTGNAKEAGEVLVFYECRCSDAMISRMVENMNESDRKELFGDSQQLEIECPRCGRGYIVTRKVGRKKGT